MSSSDSTSSVLQRGVNLFASSSSPLRAAMHQYVPLSVSSVVEGLAHEIAPALQGLRPRPTNTAEDGANDGVETKTDRLVDSSSSSTKPKRSLSALEDKALLALVTLCSNPSAFGTNAAIKLQEGVTALQAYTSSSSPAKVISSLAAAAVRHTTGTAPINPRHHDEVAELSELYTVFSVVGDSFSSSVGGSSSTSTTVAVEEAVKKNGSRRPSLSKRLLSASAKALAFYAPTRAIEALLDVDEAVYSLYIGVSRLSPVLKKKNNARHANDDAVAVEDAAQMIDELQKQFSVCSHSEITNGAAAVTSSANAGPTTHLAFATSFATAVAQSVASATRCALENAEDALLSNVSFVSLVNRFDGSVVASSPFTKKDAIAPAQQHETEEEGQLWEEIADVLCN